MCHNLLTVDKYYKMSDHELEREAHRWNIKGYAFESGIIDREKIIRQLITRHSANNSRYAIAISLAAFVVSIIALFIK